MRSCDKALKWPPTSGASAPATAQVAALAEWLADLGVTTVAMEATGVYWKPIYYGLEGLFEELWLCNAQHAEDDAGAKTDIADAEWLADVAAHGMVRPSVVPEPAMREVPRADPLPQVARRRAGAGESSGWKRNCKTPASSSLRWPPGS